MLSLQVVVATMNQKDFSKIEEMNIQSDVIFANQTDSFFYIEKIVNGNMAKMVSTRTIGVGLNRNIGMQFANADILLFADDDIVYNDGYSEKVIKAFEDNPKADIIFFDLDSTKNGIVVSSHNNKNKKLYLWNSLRYGAGYMAIRRCALIKSNLSFSLLFGGGCKYSSGEDSLFIIDALSKKLKLFSNQYTLGKTSKDSSTWFNGYNEKYFYDKGAWIACAFPKLKYLVSLYFLYRYRKMTNMSLNKIMKLMIMGINGFKCLKGYGEILKK